MTLETLLPILEAHPYLLLFSLVLVEGPVATVCAGILVSAGLAGWAPALAVVVAADFAGDTLFYLLGRSGRRPWAARLLARLGLEGDAMARLEESFEKHGAKVLAGAKIADFAAIPTLAAAGFARMDFGRFLGWSLAFTLPKSAALSTLGFLFGESALHFARVAHASLLVPATVTAVCFVIVVSRTASLKKKPNQETEEST